MKPTRTEIEQIARHLRRVTKTLPNSTTLARHLQTVYDMTDDEWMKCWKSCRSVLSRIRTRNTIAA